MPQSDFIRSVAEPLPTHPTLIGQGATSVCYKVNRYGKWYVQKWLRPEMATNPLYVSAFKKELELGLRLDHPNIVRYVDIQMDANKFYILTDYVDGLSLDTFLTRHPNHFKNKAKQQQFVKELFSAIEYLHSHQMLHLDLKPENILITRQGHHVKLIDLGFAYQDCYPYNPAGSARYTAPEQIANAEKLSPACDVYAIGRVLQFVGIGSKRVINKCIAIDAKDRYLSVAELQMAYYTQWKKRLAMAGLCVLFVLAGYGVYSMFNTGDTKTVFKFESRHFSRSEYEEYKLDSTLRHHAQKYEGTNCSKWLLPNGEMIEMPEDVYEDACNKAKQNSIK
ncbi:serine/threonine-protein kinase [Bacteroides sp. 519]|uniref:serine/threonine-protein kinase n=1 Tax=Bacteroides sp. 519 TaxID=2302937 RepID=UPI0013D5EDB3|nr:serine/threonine-protein kinase [Bacteroides sp. 519]